MDFRMKHSQTLIFFIAITFASPTLSKNPSDVCLVTVQKSTSYKEITKLITKCPSGSVVDILGDHAYSVVSKICNFDKQIVQLKKATSSKDGMRYSAEREEWWSCVVK